MSDEYAWLIERGQPERQVARDTNRAALVCRCFDGTAARSEHEQHCPLYPKAHVVHVLPPLQQGWRCPVCATGVVPWMTYCPRCARRESLTEEVPAFLGHVAVVAVEPCIDGGDHLEHVWPVESYKHAMQEDCLCLPEFLSDEYGFYWLHNRVTEEDSDVRT